jgi:hypothetical protein
MDARTYFLLLHEEAHTWGMARRIFSVPTPEQWRAILPGHNSIAWCIWHLAVGEDWGVATLRGGEKLLTRDGWEAQLGVAWPNFGMGMTAEDVAWLSATIDLDALRAYYDAVYAETRRFVQEFDFDTIDTPLAPETLRHALDLLHADEGAREFFASWTSARYYLNIMALMDVYYHIDEAGHVMRALMPERQFP